jgi:hypothetical protein
MYKNWSYWSASDRFEREHFARDFAQASVLDALAQLARDPAAIQKAEAKSLSDAMFHARLSWDAEEALNHNVTFPTAAETNGNLDPNTRLYFDIKKAARNTLDDPLHRNVKAANEKLVFSDYHGLYENTASSARRIRESALSRMTEVVSDTEPVLRDHAMGDTAFDSITGVNLEADIRLQDLKARESRSKNLVLDLQILGVIIVLLKDVVPKDDAATKDSAHTAVTPTLFRG